MLINLLKNQSEFISDSNSVSCLVGDYAQGKTFGLLCKVATVSVGKPNRKVYVCNKHYVKSIQDHKFVCDIFEKWNIEFTKSLSNLNIKLSNGSVIHFVDERQDIRYLYGIVPTDVFIDNAESSSVEYLEFLVNRLFRQGTTDRTLNITCQKGKIPSYIVELFKYNRK